MYYLTRFCRICIQTGVKLVDIETTDIDSIKLSKKLEKCGQMVINRESLSTEICSQCVKKLRIAYEFQNMCRKSSSLLQGLLTELIQEEKVDSEELKNTELRVRLSPLHNTDGRIYGWKTKRRITKTERCSILKSLLAQNNNENLVGVKRIINFTRTFNFGISSLRYQKRSPLDALQSFSENFFKNNTYTFRETISSIVQVLDEDSDEDCEEMFAEVEDDESTTKNMFEEVVIEPDIKIKSEFFEEEDVTLEEEVNCKEEPLDEEDYPIKDEPSDLFISTDFSDTSVFNSGEGGSSGSLEKLNNFVFPSDNNNVMFPHVKFKCRTRNQPYINPNLRDQFMFQNFQCKKCPRYFKSQGYLKAHLSKVHRSS